MTAVTSDLQPIVHEVDAAIAGADAVRRETMLREVTELFIAAKDRLTDELARAFDAVFVRLAREVGSIARAQLARVLAACPSAPFLIVRDLARDASLKVAALLLERHPALSEADLAAIAQRRSEGHLLAIARRPTLGKRLTDALLNRGLRSVRRALVKHAGAQFSERGFTTLVVAGGSDPALLVVLRQRTDVPPAHHKRLLGLRGPYAQRLLDFEFGPAVQQALMDEVA